AFEQQRGRGAVDLLALHELDRQPVRVAPLYMVEQFDRFEEEGLAPLPVAQPLQTRAAEDRAPRTQPLAHALNRRPRTQRKSAEIELRQAQMRHQLAQIAGEYAPRIMFRLVRLATESVRTKVGHDH